MKKLIIAALALGMAFSSFGATRYLYLDAADDSPFVITTSEGGTDTMNINVMDDGTPIVSASYTPLLVIGKTDRFADTTTITGTATAGSAATFLLTTVSYSAHWEGRPVKLMYRTGSAGSYAYYYRKSGTLRFDDTLKVDGDTKAAIQFGGYNGGVVVAAEHGAGAIGTYVAPETSRYVQNGTIITEIKFDMTGLICRATNDTVIGLASGAAYIGQNNTTNNGIIYKMELACLEVPATGDDDINVVANSSAALAYGGTGGTTYGINGGNAAAGQTVANLVQGLTANHYYYLTAGTGDKTNQTYTAGQFILRTYGHPAL